MKIKTALLLAAVLASMNMSNAFANDVETQEWKRVYKVADLLLVRPIGAIATAAGAGLYVATIPVTVAGGDSEEAAEILVKKPARQAFGRPQAKMRSTRR